MKTDIRIEEFRVPPGDIAAAPWYVVPADNKKNTRLIISQVLLDTFNELEMAYPTATAKHRSELKKIRKQL